MPTLQRGNAEIYYEIEGAESDPCVTLLNGYSRSSSDFRLLSRNLVSQNWRVLRLDNRGAGKTVTGSGFTVNDMVTDVIELWNALEISQSHLAGVSYGGVLSILLASQNPTRVRSLMLISTTPSSFFLGLDNNLSSQTPENIEKNLARYFSSHFAENNPVLYRSLIKETAKTFIDPLSRARTQMQRAALKVFDFTPLLHSIQCPTLILHGEDDEVIVPDAAEVAHRAIKQSTLRLVPEVGHLFLAENPKLLYAEILQFLAISR
jgi:3-oxoadipate enol-lactonase